MLGSSPDTVKDEAKFAAKEKIPFPLLADADRVLAQAYGVLKEKSLYGRKFMGVERTTFVIGGEGRVQAILNRVKPEGHAAEVLALLSPAP